jgi:hypothetical protein
MAEQADLDELARRYLDLWQDQMTALANDPEMAEAMEQMLRMLGFAPPGDEGARRQGAQPGFAGGWPAGGFGAPGGAGPQAQPGAAWGWPMAMLAALGGAGPQMPGGWPQPGPPGGAGPGNMPG